MNYTQTLDWLFKQLPMYQRVGKIAYKANLDQTILLDDYLGNPHQSFKSIHVAGTNGKGSTCHMMASVLQEAGYKVGLYTSPHLKDFRERIRINGEMVSQKYVIDFVAHHKTFFEKNKLSFFEMTVGMAFQCFRDNNVDVAVIETGLGGRLDSTNIITPLISVITSIDKDHVALLGNTLIKIANEKAGIIKQSVPVVIGERRSFLRNRFRESAQIKNVPYHQVNHRLKALSSDLKGAYQKDNIRVAMTALNVLKENNYFIITQEHMENGMLNVISNTGLKGRYELIQSRPKVIVETAHNPAGIKSLIKQLKAETFKDLHIVLGMVADKDVATVIALLPKNAMYHLSMPDVPRGMNTEILASYFEKFNLTHIKYSTISSALKGAKKLVDNDDLIIVTGSVFVVAEVI